MREGRQSILIMIDRIELRIHSGPPRGMKREGMAVHDWHWQIQPQLPIGMQDGHGDVLVSSPLGTLL